MPNVGNVQLPTPADAINVGGFAGLIFFCFVLFVAAAFYGLYRIHTAKERSHSEMATAFTNSLGNVVDKTTAAIREAGTETASAHRDVGTALERLSTRIDTALDLGAIPRRRVG